MSQFTPQDWQDVVGHLGDALGADAKQWQDKKVARLVAAIPYLAGAADPDRQAVSNLLVLHGAAKARKLFDHRKTDDADLMRRLASFDFGRSADPKVVQYGLNLLALVMIADHEKDLEADKKAGKYNPVASGVWKADIQKKQIQTALSADASSQKLFSDVMTPEQAVQAWWEG